jgi:hypothetical protein
LIFSVLLNFVVILALTLRQEKIKFIWLLFISDYVKVVICILVHNFIGLLVVYYLLLYIKPGKLFRIGSKFDNAVRLYNGPFFLADT